MNPARGKSTLVFGIDFGTTYSGVSWLFCRENSPIKEPEVVTHWLSALSSNSDRTKVPSKIYYKKETGQTQWGYNIPTDLQPIQWFKLLLLEKNDLPADIRNSSHIQRARDMMTAEGKTAVGLVGNYLKVLWEHIISEINDEKGPSLVNGTAFHVVLTIPAIWKDYARDRMRQAAEQAGILDDRLAGKTTLDFITEPEAAAIATLPDLDARDDLVVGDSFVVLDAGGGTVDIISYKVEKLAPLVVSECVEGDGALCGATFVDSAFETFIEQRVGRKSWKLMKDTDIKKWMNNEWEHGIKKDFDGSQAKYCIDLPKRNKRGQMSICNEEIRGIFEPVLSQIHDLFLKQLIAVKCRTGKNPKFVILVGGFGRCPFLFKRLTQQFNGITDILQARGEKPWSAICRGAVLSGAMGRGLTEQVVKVQSRVARMSYGWKFWTEFNPNCHDLRDKVWDRVRGKWMASNQIEWAIKRGQDMSNLKPVTYKYRRYFDIGEKGVRKLKDELFTSESLHPSSRHDNTVNYHSTIKYPTSCPVQDMPLKPRRGSLGSYHVWDFKYKMQVSGAALTISIIPGNKKGSEIASTSLTVKTE
ncbi:hypothetical protein F4802DRAFT_618248 [Xylaria palmicola]|nr:hypothetical protein F4802DRAFT_618248 [Xylaria palmicola]